MATKRKRARAKAKPKLSLTIKVFIIVVILLGAAIALGGIPETAQFFAPNKLAQVKIPAKIVSPAPKPVSQIITVCKSGACDSLTIQGGIDKAKPGYIILITDKDMYNETIVINKKNITLDCNGATIPEVDPDISGMSILADGVTVKGCILQQTNVRATASFLRIIGNTIDISFSIAGLPGISIDGNSNLIENNYVTAWNGIYIFTGQSNSIRSNIIFVPAEKTGIFGGTGINTGSWDTISNNTINGGLFGIQAGSNSQVTDNAITGSSSVGAAGVVTQNENNVLIRNNRISNVFSGVWAGRNTSNIRIDKNIITNASDAAIFIIESSQDVIYNNIVTNATIGINLEENTFNTTINNNELIGVNRGIDLNDSSYNKVTGNKISNVNGDAIWLYGSSYNEVTGNNMSHTSDNAISIFGSSQNLIHNNIVTNAAAMGINLKENTFNITISNNELTNVNSGIGLSDSSYNKVTGNKISNVDNSGINLDSNYNEITENTISRAKVGIILYEGASNNLIASNQIVTATWGIYFFESAATGKNNAANNNYVCFNTDYDIYCPSGTFSGSNNTANKVSCPNLQNTIDNCEVGQCLGIHVPCDTFSGEPAICTLHGCTAGGKGGQQCIGTPHACSDLNTRVKCEAESAEGCTWQH
jgi:parallel beta-helix repeat protein